MGDLKGINGNNKSSLCYLNPPWNFLVVIVDKSNYHAVRVKDSLHGNQGYRRGIIIPSRLENKGGEEMVSNHAFYIKFFAPVVPESIAALMQIVDKKLEQGAKKLGLLISSPGGDVFQGLSAYNFLKGIPLEITTHNFGSADSIGVVLFCSGSRRLSVPHARFLLHGVQCNFHQPVSLEEKQLEERLKGLQIDMGNIACVIADTVKKDKEQVLQDMLNRTTLYPEQAIEYGLVHDIKSELFPAGSDIVSIQMAPKPSGPDKAASPLFEASDAVIVENR